MFCHRFYGSVYTVLACMKDIIYETTSSVYPVMSHGILLNNSLLPKHLIRLLYLRLILQHFAPVIHQLYASVFHSLGRHVAEKLHNIPQSVHHTT